MGMTPGRVGWRSSSIAACALLLGIVSCASGPTAGDSSPLEERDSRAIEQLAEIAARDAAIEGTVRETECWAPSANPIDGGFRVICRVHYEQQGDDRYRDMICIGSLANDPVADYCYQWAYYTDMPKFEDRPAYAAQG